MLKFNNNRLRPWWKYCALSFLFLIPIFSKADGFNFIDDKTECIIPFEFIHNLIVVPVIINDGVQVNLVLDTGGRSVILFGKQFEKKLDILDKEIPLKGYGKNRNKRARLSLDNDVRLGDVHGTGISVFVANGRNFFPYNNKLRIHGIIGYQVFCRFVVTLDYEKQEIKLTEPAHYYPPNDYTSLDLTLKDTKPYIKLKYKMDSNQNLKGYFHIDTGSSRDVLLFLNSESETKNSSFIPAEVGKGINGSISGYKSRNDPLTISEFDAKAEYYLVKRKFGRKEIQNAEGSIGSGLLKNYVVVLDYINQRFYFKRNT